MDIKAVIFNFIGGIALFLYGMLQISEGLEKTAGNRLKSILKNATSNRFKGILTGVTVTSILQSSSVVTVILISFVNAQLISLENSVGIIMGTNIGTTVTAQIVAFQIGAYAMLLIGGGFCAYFLGKNEKVKYLGKVFFGLGLIFVGMDLMSNELKVLKTDPQVIGFLTEMSRVHLYGLLTGLIFTGIIQSSSVTTSLIVAMGKEGLISLEGAIPLIMGANIGTCVTGLLASIGTSISARRTAMVHLFFNIIGVCVLFWFVKPYAAIVGHTADNLGRQIANAHTLFNVVTTLMLLPAISLLIKLVKAIVPGEDIVSGTEVNILDKRLLNVPSIALEQVYNEVTRMIGLITEMFSDVADLNQNYQEQRYNLISSKEKTLDQMHREVNSYLTELTETSLNDEESAKLSTFFHAIDDIERSGDHLEKIAERIKNRKESQKSLCQEAAKEINEVMQTIRQLYAVLNHAWQKWDTTLAKDVLDIEDKIDALRRQYLQNHLTRQQQGSNVPELAFIYTDLLRRLERLGDHSDNIAHAILTHPDFSL